MCNVFRILGCSTAELKHSYFLKWLLFHDSFFIRFVKACGVDFKDIANNLGKKIEEIDLSRRINREETYKVEDLDKIPIGKECYEENTTYRHIDLNIVPPIKS
ncbi:MAG: hypothetical protein IIT39_00620 [Clostridia bacterium]|nr:hypothetical protein [Clostridia bacterium]